MKVFVPRGPNDVPSKTDPLWLHYSYGGKNKCMERFYHTVLPNCTGYAWGRFMEILGETPKLSTADAGMWYNTTSDGYKRSGNNKGQPQLGAVICWGQYNKAGHVAIVEGINPDGSLVISESGYNYGYQPWSEVYHVRTVYPPNYRVTEWMGSDYYFQGFIYNPACENLYSPVNDFISTVKSHVGYTSSWVRSIVELKSNDHWNVAFIAACAKLANIPESILPRTTSATTLLTDTSGELLLNISKLSIGDIVTVSSRNELGVVTDVTNTQYTVVVGDQGSSDPTKSVVKECKFNVISSELRKAWRPNWGVNTSIATGNLAFNTTALYDTRSQPGDAICREIGYLDNNYEPSINVSGIKLSAINYTDVAQGAFNFWLAAVAASNPDLKDMYNVSSAVFSGDMHDISSQERAGLEYFQSKGVGIAATVGIMANIYCESHWNLTAAKVDDIEASYGLNQWNVRSGRDMRGWLAARGIDWKTSLSGQLDFLWYEVTSNSVFKSMLTFINNLPATLDGCKKAARMWVRVFGLYMIDDEPDILFTTYYPSRDAAAEMYWNKLNHQLVSDS